jgi:predicted metal-dependent phosphotriesterase family hydrolase
LAALVRDVVPVLRSAGMSDEALSRVLIGNPARFLAFAEVEQ